jgi:hypothetical protein
MFFISASVQKTFTAFPKKTSFFSPRAHHGFAPFMGFSG